MLVVRHSSGDVLADRRYAYAQSALADGDAQAAADLAEQTLDLVPRFAPGWVLLGRAREALHRASGERGPCRAAARAFATALDLDPEDRLGARLALAQQTGEAALDALSPAYVRALFDAYAPRFERHLVGVLGYEGPRVVDEALAAVLGRPLPRFSRVVDLGCGTGLMARMLAPGAACIVGVDLAPGMVEAARRTRLYASVAEEEAVAFLAGEAPGSADLVVAADVVPYLGPLGPFLAGAARVLAPRGHLAFTAHRHDGPGIVLGADACFAHGRAAILAAAAEAGLAVRHLADTSVRRHRGVPIPGLVAVMERA